MKSLDEIDLRILDALQKDGRLPILMLADKVGLSPTPCSRRVRQLEDAGIIDRYIAVLNAKRLGIGFEAFVEVRLKSSSSRVIANFERAIQRMPEVTEAYFVTGQSDYLLRARAEDPDHFREFLRERLLKIPDIGQTMSSIVLERIKHTTVLTLPRFAP